MDALMIKPTPPSILAMTTLLAFGSSVVREAVHELLYSLALYYNVTVTIIRFPLHIFGFLVGHHHVRIAVLSGFLLLVVASYRVSVSASVQDASICGHILTQLHSRACNWVTPATVLQTVRDSLYDFTQTFHESKIPMHDTHMCIY